MYYDNMIGKHVKYYDYLGLERFGVIVAIEPYVDDILYIYIEDEEMEYNIHEDIVCNKPIKYAELRLSTEVYIDE